MSTLRTDVSAAVAARDAAIARLDDAVSAFAGDPHDQTVHEVRKSLKRARSMLRLVRPALQPRIFDASNRVLRDAGRGLALVRDAWVRIETLDALIGRGGDLVSPGTFAPLRDALVAHHGEVTAAVLDDPRTLSDVRAALDEARALVATWDVPPDPAEGDAVVVAGLARVFAQGRRRYARAARKPRPVRLHDWRKRVKDLGYQVRLLGPAWTPVLEAQAAECQVTWDRLGTDHDLVVLREDVDGLADVFARPADLALLDDLIDHRRAELQRGALSLGRRLYAEEPEAFVARVGGYLEAWHRDAEQAA